MIIIILWVAVSATCGAICEKQGRSTLEGLVMGAFFGILAIIGYLIAGDTLEAKARKQVELARRVSELSREAP